MSPSAQHPIPAGGDTGPNGPRGAAFLLAQVGAHAAARFADRIAELDLTPPQAGLLRVIGTQPGSSQQQVASRLGMLPSRLVPLVDDLEERGLVHRERSRSDRRQYELTLTRDAGSLMRRLRGAARAHDREMCRSLGEDEREVLADLLARIAGAEGLDDGVHPGYRRM